MQEQSKFVRHKLPLPFMWCSDPVSMNEDKSAHCFSCAAHFPNYVDACDGKIMDTNPKPKVSNTFLNTYTGSFGALTDRCISETQLKSMGLGMLLVQTIKYHNTSTLTSMVTKWSVLRHAS
jgi:hypothetical protein